MRAVKKRHAPPALRAALTFEGLDPGQPLESLTAPALTQVALARFAGATDDYNPLHLDERAAVAAGKATVFASVNLLMAYLGRMVELWLQGAPLRRFGVRMMRLVWPGDVLTCRGQVVAKRVEDGLCIVDVDVWADNQRGETVAKGRVLAAVPAGVDEPLVGQVAGWSFRHPAAFL